MDEKERRKLLGLLLINSGIFYIQGKKKGKKSVLGDLDGWKNGLSNVIDLVLIAPFLKSFIWTIIVKKHASL